MAFFVVNSKTLMFTTKKTSLFTTPAKKAAKATVSVGKIKLPKSAFVKAAMKKTAETQSGNGAKKYSTTGSALVDQFGTVGTYRKPRAYFEIEKDCETAWAEDQLLAVKFIGYLRTVTRKVQLFNGQTTQEPQKGAELKHEAITRMIWLHIKSPETFWTNLPIFISLGSWHDVFSMLQYDLMYNGWEDRKLDWTKFGEFILSGLENQNTVQLVKKYLPHIKARSDCKTVEAQANNIIAKWICNLLYGEKESSYNYKQYRKLKTSGTAHEWQKLISQKKFNRIDFGKIHGRALNILVKGKFLKNQGLSEKYTAWVTKPTTEVKFTGFVNELFEKLPKSLSDLDKNRRETINKAFQTLVEKGRDSQQENQTRFIVARDISSSMTSTAEGLSMSSFDVAKALALYFSEFLTGEFADSYLCFANETAMCSWKGKTPIEKWYNDKTLSFGGTDFMGVARLFAKLKKQGISEEDFPTGTICISDGDFNSAYANNTNAEAFKQVLRTAGFSKQFVDNFVIVLWNIPNGYYGRSKAQYEGMADQKAIYYFSGYSGSVISFLLGKEVLTAAEIFEKAMEQEVLSLIELR